MQAKLKWLLKNVYQKSTEKFRQPLDREPRIDIAAASVVTAPEEMNLGFSATSNSSTFTIMHCQYLIKHI